MVDKIRYATPQQLFASGKDFVFAKNHRGFLAKCNSTETIYIYRFTAITGNTYIYREREDIKQHTTTMQLFSQKVKNCKIFVSK